MNILLPKSVESEFNVFTVKPEHRLYYAPVQTLNSLCGEMQVSCTTVGKVIGSKCLSFQIFLD